MPARVRSIGPGSTSKSRRMVPGARVTMRIIPSGPVPTQAFADHQ